MEDTPHSDELIGAVRDFLRDEVMSELDGRKAFHARVAVNALSIVERQLQRGPRQKSDEHERLKALLDRDGGLAELNRDLAERIRSGALTLEDAGLEEHLRKTTLDKVAIDQPKYSGYRAALEESDE